MIDRSAGPDGLDSSNVTVIPSLTNAVKDGEAGAEAAATAVTGGCCCVDERGDDDDAAPPKSSPNPNPFAALPLVPVPAPNGSGGEVVEKRSSTGP